MQRIGVGWLGWELSHSGAVLGLVAFADLFPTVLIGPFGGALADRVDRLRLIKIAQLLGMAQALILFLLTVSGLITVPLLMALVLFGGVGDRRQPAGAARAGPEPRAAPATSRPRSRSTASCSTRARFIGPALAGLAIVWLGVARCSRSTR